MITKVMVNGEERLAIVTQYWHMDDVKLVAKSILQIFSVLFTGEENLTLVSSDALRDLLGLYSDIAEEGGES